MKNKSKALQGSAIIILLLFNTGLYAQTDTGNIFNHPLQSANMDAFIRTCARLAEHQFVTGNFEQERRLNRLGRSLISSGNFIIARDMGMVWDTLSPFPSSLTLGKDHIIQSRPGGQRSLISAQGNETFLSIAEIISTIFSGNSQSLLDNFQVFFYSSPNDWELGLIPRSNVLLGFMEKITMRGSSAIRFIEIHEQNGDSITYTLLNHRHPIELSEHEKDFFTIP